MEKETPWNKQLHEKPGEERGEDKAWEPLPQPEIKRPEGDSGLPDLEIVTEPVRRQGRVRRKIQPYLPN